MTIKRLKILFLVIENTVSVSLQLKFAVLGQNWEENSYLRRQNISAILDGTDGSKDVDKLLLEV